MASTATFQLNISAFGGGKDFTQTLSGYNATSPVEPFTQYPFTTGYQDLAVPANAKKLIISNLTGGTLTLKGVTGDTGRSITTTDFPEVLTVVGGATIGLTASAGAKADLLFI